MANRRFWIGNRRVRGLGDPAPSGPEVRDLWVEEEIGDGWTAAFRVFEQAGRLVVGELRVFPTEPDEGNPQASAYPDTGVRPAGHWSADQLGDRSATVPDGGLTARKLRDVRLEAVRVNARELLARARLEEGAPVDELFAPGGLLAERRIDSATFDRSARGRRAAHDDAFLANVAAVYVALVRSGSKRPTPETAYEIRYSITQTKRFIAQARERGLLTETVKRRAGGELTDKAREILRREAEET
jgi:hypothetical protein